VFRFNALDVFPYADNQKQGGVDEGVGHQQPLKNPKWKDAQQNSRDEAGACIPIEAHQLNHTIATSGKLIFSKLKNFSMKNRVSGTPIPKL